MNSRTNIVNLMIGNILSRCACATQRGVCLCVSVVGESVPAFVCACVFVCVPLSVYASLYLRACV